MVFAFKMDIRLNIVYGALSIPDDLMLQEIFYPSLIFGCMKARWFPTMWSEVPRIECHFALQLPLRVYISRVLNMVVLS